jgi:hypothetical protein
MTILLLYGDFGVDFEMVVKYLQNKHSYKATKLRELTENDIKDGQLTVQAEDDLDTTFSII